MSKVYLDVSVFGERWFQETALGELRESNRVTFTFTRGGSGGGEIDRVLKLKDFLKIMSEKGRAQEVPSEELQEKLCFLEQQPAWKNHSECDDAHIFSVVCIVGKCFVFSTDLRMVKCRKKLKKSVKKEFCNFLVVPRKDVYDKKKQDIFS